MLIKFKDQFFFLFLFVLHFTSSFSSSRHFSSSNFTIQTEKKLRILGAFPHTGFSHFKVFKPLLDELARKGHNLTVVSFFPRSLNEEETFLNYKDISLAESPHMSINAYNMTHLPPTSIINVMLTFEHVFFSRALINCGLALKNPGVRNLIHSDAEFDLILTEIFASDCFLGFAHR